ncbi:MAG: macro domain-containing protein [Candidatus Latescibacteria bacterium]|nr:macro domain-containing protein [Candidatus Latescibacterota bacterium]
MKIAKTKLDVLQNDISEVKTDAIINPANDMLWMGGGVSSLIRKSGGETIESEALAKAPVKIGEAVVSGAGKLKARWVIHAVISGQDLVATDPSIRNAAKAALDKANDLGCSSVAIPILTTDVSHIEIHIAVHIIVEETVNYLIDNNKTLTYVAFIEKDKSLCDILRDSLMEMFTKHG